MTYISELGTSQNQSLTSSLEGTAMGKEDFLKLLVAQLQHQDPMNPSDATEFTAQLAQFSSLEQLFAVNENLAEMSSSNGELKRMSALSMIGNYIVSEEKGFRFNGDTAEIGYRLDNNATEVRIHIEDEFGRTVASIEGAETAGEHFYNWDGTDSTGQIVPPGKYSIFLSATGLDDEIISATPLVKGKVTGVDLDDKGHVLVTNAGDFRLDSITRVSSSQ